MADHREGLGSGVPNRRRAARVTVQESAWLAVPSAWPIQLADVGLGGIAFTSPYALEVGRCASIRATLGRAAFNGHFRVCWLRPHGTTNGSRSHFDVGAMFVDLDDSSRQALETFLKLSPPSESQHENQGR
jgi:hypothetical protein